MNINGFNGEQYVELKGFYKAIGSDIDIVDSLTLTDRNYDTVEDLMFCFNTKVFMENPSLLWFFAHSIAFTYGTTMSFHDNDNKPFEIRLELTPTGNYDDWKVSASIEATFSKTIDVESEQYKEHIENYTNQYEKLVGEKICYKDGYVLYDFQTLEDVIEYDTMRYEEMILENAGEARIELDVDFSSDEVEAIKNYFIGYCDKYVNPETA